MVGPGFLTIGWQLAAVSLLVCLVYALLYPQFRERAFRLWIAGWVLSSLFGFSAGAGPTLWRVLALLAATAGSALLLGSIMEWIGWDRRLHYLWPLGLALIAIVSLGFVLEPQSQLAWWGAHLLHAGFSIAAGWLLWRSPLRVHFPALAALSGAMLLRGLHLLDPSHLPGADKNPLQLHLDFYLLVGVGMAMMAAVVSEIRRRGRQFDLGLENFAEMSTAAAGATGTDELFLMILARMLEHLRASAGWIGLAARDEKGGRLKLSYVAGFSDAFRREPPEYDIQERWVERIAASGAQIFSLDDDSGNDIRRLLRSERLGALVCAPLYSEERSAEGKRELLGILAAGSANPREFTNADLRFLTSVADLVQVHEQRLRLSEQAARTKRQWMALLDEVEDPVLLHDDRYRIVQANASAARRLGMEANRLTGSLLRDVLRPGPTHWNHCPYCEEVAGHPDTRDPNFGGFLAATAAAVEGPDGRHATLHLLRDVTARRRAEEKLRNLFENMQEGAFLSTPGGRFLDFNDSFRRMLGYDTREELLCADIPGHLFVNSVDRDRLMKLLRDHGSVSGFEFTMRRKDGEIINVMESSVAVRDASGAVVAVQGFVLDVTERKRAELEVRRRNRELLLLNSIGQALSQPLELDDLLTRTLRQVTDLFDLDVAAVFLLEAGTGAVESRAAVGLRSKAADWGLPKAVPPELLEQIHRTHATVLPPQALAPSGFQNLSEEEGLQVWRMIVLWWKERIVGGLLVGSRTRNELAGAELSLLVAVANQISARVETTSLYEATRQALETLRRTQEQLVQSEKMVAIGQLISGVAHELNNPLTAILGYSELLEASPGATVQTGEFAVKIAKQAQRTQKIVQNLLSFARQQKAERRAVGINDVLEDTLALRDYDWRRCRISIHRDLDPGLTDIQGDRHQLQQVFLNILNNAFDALKAAPEPRSIWVRTGREGDRVLIEVTDSGAGVREPTRVFDPFYTTKPVGEGTGLGLSICYGILKEHGGEITVRNVAAGGACFTVYLPIQLGSVPGPRTEASAPAGPAARAASTGVVILLVDDEEAVLEVEREILRERGYTVHTATNVASATTLLETAEVDVIIADFKLSGFLGGQELYGWLRHRRPGLADRLIFTFADGQSEDAALFLAASGCASLHKPFRVDELLTAVHQALAHRGASALME